MKKEAGKFLQIVSKFYVTLHSLTILKTVTFSHNPSAAKLYIPVSSTLWQFYPLFYNISFLKHISSSSSSSSSSYICHGVGPLVDPFRSHVSRSLFKGLPWFLLPAGEWESWQTSEETSGYVNIYCRCNNLKHILQI